MLAGSNKYKYLSYVDGAACYGEVEVEISLAKGDSTITDDCNWKTLKQSYPNFVESEILQIWKQSAIEAAEYVLDKYEIPTSAQISIKDIIGVYVDTTPAAIGAAMIMGIFDLIDNPLEPEDLQLVDDFVFENRDFDAIPNYGKLILSKSKKPD